MDFTLEEMRDLMNEEHSQIPGANKEKYSTYDAKLACRAIYKLVELKRAVKKAMKKK